MTFTSLTFFLFLPLVYLVFYFAKDRYRWLVLLTASYAFYATLKAPQLLLALALTTVISYGCGIRLGNTKDARGRQRILWLGIAGCVLLLGGMKYLPVLLPSVDSDSPYARLLITIGVSYFVFQAISYLIDIYLDIQEPERHLGYHALALAFFPKLLQGPIERAGRLLPQLKKPYLFDYDAIRSGMLLFAWGLFKKVVIADRFALYVSPVYNNVQAYTGLPLLLATYAYALQLYFDFSGYTDMARGTARMFGVNLMENFNRPYLATSVADFWRRWHISFSSWILDYIFKPLQMAWRDWKQAGTALALIVTFLVSGIWHGASWGFVVWGLLHGIYLATSTYYRPYQKKLHKWLGVEKSTWLKAWQIFVVFNLVSFAWIFFRAASLADAWYVVRHMLDFGGNLDLVRQMGWHDFKRAYLYLGVGSQALKAVVFGLAVIFIVHKNRHVVMGERPAWFRWMVYVGLVYAIIFLATGDTQFVYFKF